MSTLARFVGAGLLFAAFPGEISNQLLIHRSVRGFGITMANYVWFLALAYCIRGWLDRRFASRGISRLCLYLLYGAIGLAIEWFLLHVFPFQVTNPAQLMMFSFWAGMVTTACIFTDEPVSAQLAAVRRGLLCYISIWSAISLLPFVIASLLGPGEHQGARNFSILVFGVGALGVNYWFYRYYRLLRAIAKPVGAAGA